MDVRAQRATFEFRSGRRRVPAIGRRNHRPGPETEQTGPRPGTVALVGAGPGDPELLTIKAWRYLNSADVVLYDALVSDQILDLAQPGAELVFVGKRAGGIGWRQPDITARIIAEAEAGRRVVRLKGGDPFVFGRGGEEAIAIAARHIDVEVVPGISSAVAAPGSAGIPVTHRGVSTHFTVVTGHSADDPALLRERWVHLARAGGTLIFLMPTRNLARIVGALREAGVADTCPAALVASGTRGEQRVIEATVDTIEAAMASAGTPTPATLVVGEVVALRHAILGVSAQVRNATL